MLNEVLNNSFKLDKNWNLTKQHATDYKKHFILKKLDQLFQSTYYNFLILAQILIESIVVSSIDYNDLSGNWNAKFNFHFFTEVILTLLFVADVLLKTITYGYKIYLKESIHKFELCLAIGCLINLIPSINRLAYFILFKCLRIIRLIRASPLLGMYILIIC